ncbi:MAG TPA: hypothetical protein VH482_32555 [Thermomicrobiales bacterium]|jgi:hypothetical protein
MPDQSDEIDCHLKEFEGAGWLVILLGVGADQILAMVPNPLASRSVISPATFARLVEQGVVSAGIHDIRTRAKSCILRHLSIEGQPVPDLEVRIRKHASFLRADGYLGQDFLFGNFTDIHLDIDRRLLRLKRRHDR